MFDKAVLLVNALTLTEGADRLFPNGIEYARVVLAVADRKLELELGGRRTAEQLGRNRLLELAATDHHRAEVTRAAAFILLPPVSGNGYYSYSPAASQYGTNATINAVVDVGRQWLFNHQPAFGVGDISLQQGGPMPGHTTGHQLGRNVDVRPMRTDGQAAPVTWQDPAYSRELTQLLVDNFRAHANCTRIYFNDPNINGVQPLSGHDNHLHVEMAA